MVREKETRILEVSACEIVSTGVFVALSLVVFLFSCCSAFVLLCVAWNCFIFIAGHRS